MHSAVLDIDRMTRRELWQALHRRLELINPDTAVHVPFRQKRVCYWEAIAIVKDLERRGIQMELPLGKGQ